MRLEDFQLLSSSTKTPGLMALPFCAEDRWPKQPEIPVELKEDDPEVKRKGKLLQQSL